MPTTTEAERPRCRVERCRRPLMYKAAELCQVHYFRLRRRGVLGGAEPQRPRWRGDDVGYVGQHLRLVQVFGPASDYECADGCGRRAAEWSYDHADPDERYHPRGYAYSLDGDHYWPLCVSCHRRLDAGR